MKRLRIAIIAQLFTPLPPREYGGVERVVCAVSDALKARGHEVTIFGPDDTKTACRSIPFGPVIGEYKSETLRMRMRLWSLLSSHRKQFDVVHDFFRVLLMLPLLPRRIPKLASFACPIDPKTVRMADRLAGRSIHYAVCGAHMLKQLTPEMDRSKWHVVPNPIALAPYQLRKTPNTTDPYLVFLSRMVKDKGAHTAIEVARRVNKKLILAGNIVPIYGPYFEDEVLPLVDGVKVQYIGPVDDAKKNELLGGAEAMLFPLQWEEPFGLVMGEAMACGTPVLAFRRGAIPEIIEDGRTGYISTTTEEMVRDVARIGEIDRTACRLSVERRFSPDIIAEGYEEVYRRILAGEASAAYQAQLAHA